MPRDPVYPDLMRLNGIPVLKSHGLADFGAGNVVGLLVSMMGFRLRDSSAKRVTRYEEIPTRPDQIGFEIFADHAFGYAVDAVAKLQMHA